MAIDPIARRKLYQEVLSRLMQRIESGEFAPGDALPSERELMAHYGVGRVAVREALQELARSGIVEISQGERARVVLPTAQRMIGQLAEGARHLMRLQPDTRDHLVQARQFLEVGLVRLAAQQAGPADVDRLQARLQAHRESMDSLDHFLQRDMEFHREIARITGNPIFPAIVEALFDWAGAHARAIVRAPGAEALTLAEHQRIVEAIAAGDPEGAAKAMQEHLSRANEQYRRLSD